MQSLLLSLFTQKSESALFYKKYRDFLFAASFIHTHKKEKAREGNKEEKEERHSVHFFGGGAIYSVLNYKEF